jgi:hypothetical protein
VTGNHATDTAGALYVKGGATTEFVNIIVYGNTTNSGRGTVELAGAGSSPSFLHCCIEGGFAAFTGPGSGSGYTGTYAHCIDRDPLFFNAPEGDYSLSVFSPCIDSGTPDTTGLSLPENDLAGNMRIFGSGVDMGAYECPTDPTGQHYRVSLCRPSAVNRQGNTRTFVDLLGRTVKMGGSSGKPFAGGCYLVFQRKSKIILHGRQR